MPNRQQGPYGECAVGTLLVYCKFYFLMECGLCSMAALQQMTTVKLTKDNINRMEINITGGLWSLFVHSDNLQYCHTTHEDVLPSQP